MKTSSAVTLMAGMRLVRDWGGRTHSMFVCQDGFELLVTEGGSGGRQRNDALIRLLARAHQFRAALLGANTVAAVAASAGISVRHALWTLRLAWLAPDITQAILHGRQPASLTGDKLARLARLPNEWSAQRALLSFEPKRRA